jgi:hypothetical protein
VSDPLVNLRRIAPALVLVLAAWWTASSLATFVHSFPERDFGSLYLSVHDWWQTGALYAPRTFINLNAPHASVLLLGPLLLLPIRTAAVVWLALNAALIAVSLILIQTEVRLPADRLWWLVALVCASAAAQHQWRQGQMGGVVCALGTLAWRAARRERPSASWWTAAGASVKPWMGIWILAQPPRAALRTLVLGVLGGLLGIWWLGLPAWLAWRAAIDANLVWPFTSNLSLFGVSTRLGDPQLGARWALASAAVVGVTAWRTRPASVDRAWLAWGLAGVLVSPIGWTYYLLGIIGPLAACGEQRGWPLSMLAGVFLLVLPAAWIDLIWSLSPWLGSLYTIGVLLLWGNACRPGNTMARAEATARAFS